MSGELEHENYITSRPKVVAALTGQCWSIYEGCVCTHTKPHDDYHECDSPGCLSFWTTEQAQEWALDQSRDNHRR